MSKYRFLGRSLIIFCLISINLFPFLGVTNLGEYGAPDGSGHTSVTWMIDASDDVTYSSREFWTKDIQINSSGRMTWNDVDAYIDGNIVVNPNAYFNLTDCFLNLSGDFSIAGTVNFNNVTLWMNSSFDGEFGINVTTAGTFNVFSNSNITAYDRTTGIDVDTTIPGFESWGLHYNFTVHGTLMVDYSSVGYTYGNLVYIGGIHLYATATSNITNSILYENEISAISSEGASNVFIRNNHIYNATWAGIYLYNYASPYIDNNTIETGLDNWGFGIVCVDHCAPAIYRNTIRNNRYNGIHLLDYSNATIWNNTISDNQFAGIYFRARVISVPPVVATICNPFIYNNTIINNYEYGIFDSACHAQIRNNTISHTINGTGIWIHNYQIFITSTTTWYIGFTVRGNITNNTIQYNNHNGINLSSDYFAYPYIVTMNVDNNTITNNNWSGIRVFGGRSSGSQSSPKPHIELNNISNNDHSGISNYDTFDYNITKNEITLNNGSGVLCEAQASTKIFDNNITLNYGHGVASFGSTPDIFDNDIFYNTQSGVYGEGGSGNFRIRTNDIHNNTWSGVEFNTSSGQVLDNHITYNNQNGVKLTGGAPTLDQDNLITYNGWNGLHCAGGVVGSLSGKILFNTRSGVFTTGVGTNPEILSANISANNEHGVNATTNSAPEVTNSTIGNDNAGEAFYISGSADPISTNSIFPKASVYFQDTVSTLTVKWFVHIRTISNLTSAVIPNCNVSLDSIPQPQANPLWNGRSNLNGEINWLRITEYVDQDSNNDHRATGAERALYTPTDVTAEAFYYRVTHVIPIPIIDHSQTITVRLDPNRQPFQVTNITPMKTHNLFPKIAWNPAEDLDEEQVAIYTVWVGSIQNTSNYYDSGVIATNYHNITDPIFEYDELDGNKSYHVTIVSNDQRGGESFTYHEIYIINTKPSRPEINLSFSGDLNVDLKTVTCTITALSTDPDGDEINYTYRWYKNSQLQSGLTVSNTKNTVEDISVITDDIVFSKGEQWEVRVHADDGLPFGRGPYQSMTFTIGNKGPMVGEDILDTVMDEDTELLEYVDLTKAFIDIDQQELTYVITVDDENLKVTENKQTHKVDIVPAANWNGVANINFTCIDTEGLWATQFVKVTVNPVNDLPVFKEIGGKQWKQGLSFLFSELQAATEDEWFNITIVGSDADIENGEDDEIFFEASPNVVTITKWESDPLNATFSFLPTNDDVGIFTVTVSIKDKESNFIYPTTIEIIVNNVNDEPELVSIMKYGVAGDEYSIPQDKVLDLRGKITAYENEKLTLFIKAQDPDLANDDDDLTFYTDNVGLIEVDPSTGEAETAKIIIIPDKDSIGLLVFNLTVKDQQGKEDSAQFKMRVENVKDRPIVRIIEPAMAGRIYSYDEEIIFEIEATDYDIPYGDDLTLTIISSIDGALATDRAIILNRTEGRDTITFEVKLVDLTPGKHTLTIETVDSTHELGSNITIIERREQDIIEPPPPPDKGDDINWLFLGIIIAMIIIVVVMLVILFLVLRAKKKRKKEEEEKTAEILKGRPEPLLGPPGAPGISTLPGQYVPPSQGIPETLPEEPQPQPPQQPQAPPGAGAMPGAGAPAQMQPPGPGVPSQMPPGTAGAPSLPPPTPGAPPTQPTQPAPGPGPGATTEQPFVPPQVMTCPKCNMLMTFSPDGSVFCLRCGFKPQ